MINNTYNQNNHYNGSTDDGYGKSGVTEDNRTRVLTDDERRQFDGVTIDEIGDGIHVEEGPTKETQYGSGYNNGQNPFGNNTNFKVYTLGASSWLTRLILIAILAIIGAIVFFFGGIIVTIIGVIFVVGAIISFILGLF